VRRFRLLAVDLVLVVMATVSALALRNNLDISLVQIRSIFPNLFAALATALVVVTGLGLNRTVWRFTSMSDCLRLLGASVAIVAGSTAVVVVAGAGGLSVTFVILQTLLLAGYLIGARTLMRVRHAFRSNPAPGQFGQTSPANCAEIVLIAGVNRLADLYLRSVAEWAAGRVRVVGLLGRSVRHTARSVHRQRVMGTLEQVSDVLLDLRNRGVEVDRIVLTTPFDQLTKEEQNALRSAVRCFPLRILSVAECLGFAPSASLCRDVQPRQSSPVSTFAIPATEVANLSRQTYWRVKRIIDLIAACVLLFMLAPAFLLVAVLVALDVGLPLIFWQERPGLGGVGFRLYKFRTLPLARVGEAIGSERRFPSLGRFIRRARLDELPQLINILKGEMSFIGPRPLLAAEQSPDVATRLLVRPGLTGWAQVAGGRDVSIANKTALDIWYVRHACASLDLTILIRTARMIVWGECIDTSALLTAWRDLRHSRRRARPGKQRSAGMSEAEPDAVHPSSNAAVVSSSR
jgi:lipopolysaccharide/colanic/teichoic acid biosynthesis glycosyltransferase